MYPAGLKIENESLIPRLRQKFFCVRFHRMSSFPTSVHEMLRKASMPTPGPAFTCQVFDDPEWNAFVADWAPRIYTFVASALGPFAIEPAREIRKLDDGFHMAGATASFSPASGRICLATSISNNAGVTLEKLTHEMLHASLANFPEGDPFYEEGFVDFSTWILAHAPVWVGHREAMIQAAADNIRNRRERALKGGTDYDRKRWAGGLFASVHFGPHIITVLRQRKMEGNLTW